jgi:hypothetical protein
MMRYVPFILLVTCALSVVVFVFAPRAGRRGAVWSLAVDAVLSVLSVPVILWQAGELTLPWARVALIAPAAALAVVLVALLTRGALTPRTPRVNAAFAASLAAALCTLALVFVLNMLYWEGTNVSSLQQVLALTG